MLRFAPTARELVRVWLRPFRPPSFRDAGLTATTGWWAAVGIAQGLAFALAARTTGVETSVESLIAIAGSAYAGSAYAVASLIPAPGRLGVIEVLTYLGLAIDSDPVVAGIAVVVARVRRFGCTSPSPAGPIARRIATAGPIPSDLSPDDSWADPLRSQGRWVSAAATRASMSLG